jgi:hypothetical protein
MTEKDWQFPRYVGHRQRLTPSEGQYEDDAQEHEGLARAAARAAARDEPAQLHAKLVAVGGAVGRYLMHKFECAMCHACLPSAHLLELHLEELHDSYFAAQVSYRQRGS